MDLVVFVVLGFILIAQAAAICQLVCLRSEGEQLAVTLKANMKAWAERINAHVSSSAVGIEAVVRDTAEERRRAALAVGHESGGHEHQWFSPTGQADDFQCAVCGQKQLADSAAP